MAVRRAAGMAEERPVGRAEDKEGCKEWEVPVEAEAAQSAGGMEDMARAMVAAVKASACSEELVEVGRRVAVARALASAFAGGLRVPEGCVATAVAAISVDCQEVGWEEEAAVETEEPPRRLSMSNSDLERCRPSCARR